MSAKTYVFLILAGAAGAASAGKVPGLSDPAPERADAPAGPERLVATAGGLTADEVAARASRSSYDVAASKASVAAAGYDRAATRLSWAPRLSTSFSTMRISDPSNMAEGAPEPQDSQSKLDTQLSVPVTDYLYRIPKLNAAADAAVEAARWNQRTTVRQVGTNARVAYYAWARARLQVAVAEQAADQARTHLGDARSGFDAGTSSRADVLAVESLVASTGLDVEKARNAEAVAARRLRTAMHDDGEARYEIGEDLLEDLPPFSDAPGVEALVTEAMSARPELRAMARNEGGLAAQAAVKKAGMFPRVDLVAGMSAANPDQRAMGQGGFHRSWQAGIVMSFSPNDTLTSRDNALAGKARVAEAAARRMALEDSVRGEVEQAWYDELEARQAIKATGQSLEAAAESYRVRRELYRYGRATSGELIDAETDLTKARFAAIDARVDHRVARARLIQATGR